MLNKILKFANKLKNSEYDLIYICLENFISLFLKYSANYYPAKLACSRPFFDRGGSSFISTVLASSSTLSALSACLIIEK